MRVYVVYPVYLFPPYPYWRSTPPEPSTRARNPTHSLLASQALASSAAEPGALRSGIVSPPPCGQSVYFASGSLQLPLIVRAASALPFAPIPQVLCERKLLTLAFTTHPLMQ